MQIQIYEVSDAPNLPDFHPVLMPSGRSAYVLYSTYD